MLPVVIVGGGPAGLAAALELGRRRIPHVLLESKDRLGGRAGSFFDSATSSWVDACQHVSLGCCPRFAAFCTETGVDRLMVRHSILEFMTPDGRISRFAADPLPAPFHLARSFLRSHLFSFGEKIRLATALLRMRLTSSGHDERFADWLTRRRQSRRVIDRFWGPVVVSALNESIDRVGFRYVRKVFVDAFLKNRRGYEMIVPAVRLGELYDGPVADRIRKLGGEIRLNHAVRELEIRDGRFERAVLRNGQRVPGSAVIVAVPWNRVETLLPDLAPMAKKLRPSPISSVHLRFDRQVMDQPQLVTVETMCQWLFNKGPTADGGQYVQVVISASEESAADGNDLLRSRVTAELAQLLPRTRDARIIWSRVITDRFATFAPVPGVDRDRPPSPTAYANVVLAGDWVQTGWPATMEGAVRSGENAVRALWENGEIRQPGIR